MTLDATCQHGIFANTYCGILNFCYYFQFSFRLLTMCIDGNHCIAVRRDLGWPQINVKILSCCLIGGHFMTPDQLLIAKQGKNNINTFGTYHIGKLTRGTT